MLQKIMGQLAEQNMLIFWILYGSQPMFLDFTSGEIQKHAN